MSSEVSSSLQTLFSKSTWPQMFKMCGQIHDVTLADLRDSLIPKPTLVREEGGRPPKVDRPPKGQAKGLSAAAKRSLVQQLTDQGVSNAQDIVNNLKGRQGQESSPQEES